MIVDIDKLRVCRFWGGTDVNNIYEGNAGEKINTMCSVEFVAEYLFLREKLNIYQSSYYNRFKIKHPDNPLSAEQDCLLFINLIKDVEKNGILEAVPVFKLTDDTYILKDGHHRVSIAYVLNKKNVEVKIEDEILYVWDLKDEEINQAVNIYSKVYPQFETGVTYTPVWWKNNNKYFPFREHTKRLEAILNDIVDLKGINVLDVGCAGGFFSSSISQIPNMRVLALDEKKGWIDLMELKKKQTGLKFDTQVGTIVDLNDGYKCDAAMYLDVFHVTDEPKREIQLRRLCEITKDRIYFCLGRYDYLNKGEGFLSNYCRKIFGEYGFKIKMLHVNVEDMDSYRRPIFVAKKINV